MIGTDKSPVDLKQSLDKISHLEEAVDMIDKHIKDKLTKEVLDSQNNSVFSNGPLHSQISEDSSTE